MIILEIGEDINDLEKKAVYDGSHFNIHQNYDISSLVAVRMELKNKDFLFVFGRKNGNHEDFHGRTTCKNITPEVEEWLADHYLSVDPKDWTDETKVLFELRLDD